MARLPEGRGFKSGPGAAADQGEFDALRKRLQAVEAEARWTVPPLGMIDVNLTDAVVLVQFSTNGLGKIGGTYYGWQICNGNNGSPNVTDKFVRYSTTGLGTTGGSDTMAHTHDVDVASFTSGAETGHTHAIDHDHASFTSGADSGHTHDVNIASFNSGAEATHTHSTPNHAHLTDVGFDGTNVYLRTNGSGVPKSGNSIISDTMFNFAHLDALETPAANGRYANTNSDGSGTTGAGASHLHTVDPPNTTSATGSGHTHPVDVPALTGTSGATSGHTHAIDPPNTTSAAASNTENRPAYTTLLKLMRVPLTVYPRI